MKSIKIKVATGKGDDKKAWEVDGIEFEQSDLSVTVNGDAAKYLTPESVLSLVNRQYVTDTANESRREQTAGAPKRVETASMVSVLMGLGLTKEEAEAKIAEARKIA